MDPIRFEEASARMSILVVDDDQIILRILANVLRTGGYGDIRTAATGAGAMEQVRASPPDLVLLDIQLPDIEGYAVCRAIRTETAERDIPVLMVTGGSADADRALEESFRAGAGDFIEKPVNPMELLARVRSALRIKYSHDRLREEIQQRMEAEIAKERVIAELQAALGEIKTLSGLLPICAACKKIRNDTGYWMQIEGYISTHSKAEFTHSICPDCTRKYMDELDRNARGDGHQRPHGAADAEKPS